MRLQSVYPSGLLRNHTPFGKKLRFVGRLLLPDHLRIYDFGFQDGGCAMFAQALVQWSNGRLTLGSYVLPGRGVQHVVAREGDVVLDSDGLSTRDEGATKLAVQEMCPGCTWIDGFDPGASPRIPWSPRYSNDLADHVKRLLGVPPVEWTS